MSGKFRRGMMEPPEGTRVKVAEEKGWGERWSAYNNEHTWSVLDTLLVIAKEVGKTPAQVAIRWLMQRPGVTVPIIGARAMKQLEDNLGACAWLLGDRDMARLNRVSELPLSYPYDFIARTQRK